MNIGINRLINESSTAVYRSNSGIKCVFISHQKKDAPICRHIAQYIMSAGIDVYFDEFDQNLKNYYQQNNPRYVVNSIKSGINNSTHMLCVISPNTLFSKWVPWEVGYGYDKTKLSALTLKGIKDNELPEYLKTIEIIRGTKTLNEYISKILNTDKIKMFSERRLINESSSGHPLDSYLDWNA